MSVQSADTARERGRALTALVAAYPAPASPPWKKNTRNRNAQGLDKNSGSSHRYRSNSSSDRYLHREESNGYDAIIADCGNTTTTTATLDGDTLAGVAEQLLSWSGRGVEQQQQQRERALQEDGLDLCTSTWKSVESMARTLAAGQSVVSTIVKCYSLPSLGRRKKSDRRGGAGAGGRRAGLAATEIMHTSLLSERLVAEALAIFRRYVVLQQDCCSRTWSTRG